MPELYDDLIEGVKGHFYRLKIQNPLVKDAIKIEAIHAPYDRTPVLSVRKIVYEGNQFIPEKTKGIVHFTDLMDMNRVSDSEEKEIKSDLEKIASNNKANLSAENKIK